MGVIKRQGIKRSLVRYIGVVIGTLSMFFIYPLEGEMLGEVRFIVNTAALLVPFLLLGVNSLTVRFFATFQDKEKGHHGFLGFLLLWVLICLLGFGVLTYAFQEQLLEALAGFLGKQPDELIENTRYISLLTVSLALAAILTPYISNFNRVVVPDMLTNFSLKLVYPVLILLFYAAWISRGEVKLLVVLSHLLIVLGLLGYTRYLGQLKLKIDFGFLDKPLFKSMATYALFGIIGSIGSILATRIDYFMVTTLADEEYFGTFVYDFAVQVINVVVIPYTAFIAIANPVIAKAMHRSDLPEVQRTYQRSALVLMVAGLGLFLAAWISVDQLFLLTNKLGAVKGAKFVILFLGLGKVVDMITGLNGQIISYSKYFRFNVVAILLLGILNIFTNRYFIPIYGVTGAAIATCISLVAFNLAKVLFVWIKLGMQPFSRGTLQVTLFAALAYGVAYIIPNTSVPLLDIAIHSGAFAGLFAFLVLYFQVSTDINDLYRQVLGRLRKLRG